MHVQIQNTVGFYLCNVSTTHGGMSCLEEAYLINYALYPQPVTQYVWPL